MADLSFHVVIRHEAEVRYRKNVWEGEPRENSKRLPSLMLRWVRFPQRVHSLCPGRQSHTAHRIRFLGPVKPQSSQVPAVTRVLPWA